MNRFRALKYLILYILPISAWVSFHSDGWQSYCPVIIAFGTIPLTELCLPIDEDNLSDALESIAREDRLYDWLLYLQVVHTSLLLVFFRQINEPGLSPVAIVGRVMSMDDASTHSTPMVSRVMHPMIDRLGTSPSRAPAYADSTTYS